MRNKDDRDSVYKNHKPYLKLKETTEDLDCICKKCSCPSYYKVKENPENYEQCRGCPVMELWLSNEYGEWAGSYANY